MGGRGSHTAVPVASPSLPPRFSLVSLHAFLAYLVHQAFGFANVQATLRNALLAVRSRGESSSFGEGGERRRSVLGGAFGTMHHMDVCALLQRIWCPDAPLLELGLRVPPLLVGKGATKQPRSRGGVREKGVVSQAAMTHAIAKESCERREGGRDVSVEGLLRLQGNGSLTTAAQQLREWRLWGRALQSTLNSSAPLERRKLEKDVNYLLSLGMDTK
jgi:hypothetical protein